MTHRPDPTPSGSTRLVDELLADFPPADTDPPRSSWASSSTAGLAWVDFAEGEGGLGLSPALHHPGHHRLIEAGAPSAAMRNVIGYGMVAPTIVTHGTEEQKRRYLRPLFTGEEIWCQLFSEPGPAPTWPACPPGRVRDGDEWVVNGQKVWTTLAHLASCGLLLARTDPDVPKHKGITCFLVDMHAPGVDVRPLYQITGEAEFNEVFFTDVHLADTDRLGDVGEGWRRRAHHPHERAGLDRWQTCRAAAPAPSTTPSRIWKERWAGDTSAHALALRDRLLHAVGASRGHPPHQPAGGRPAPAAARPGPEGSVGKLAFAEQNKKIYELCVDLLGADGMLYSNDYPKIRPNGVGLGRTDVAQGVPALPGQLDRGRDLRGHAQHPGRAGARAARRRAHRQGAALEGRPPQLRRQPGAPASCPQAAAMSAPRVTRTVATTPSSASQARRTGAPPGARWRPRRSRRSR